MVISMASTTLESSEKYVFQYDDNVPQRDSGEKCTIPGTCGETMRGPALREDHDLRYTKMIRYNNRYAITRLHVRKTGCGKLRDARSGGLHTVGVVVVGLLLVL